MNVTEYERKFAARGEGGGAKSILKVVTSLRPYCRGVCSRCVIFMRMELFFLFCFALYIFFTTRVKENRFHTINLSLRLIYGNKGKLHLLQKLSTILYYACNTRRFAQCFVEIKILWTVDFSCQLTNSQIFFLSQKINWQNVILVSLNVVLIHHGIE